MFSANNLLVLILRIYCDFVGLVWYCFLHVVDEHMLFLVELFSKINIICKIVRFMQQSIFCNIWLSARWSIFFLFDLKHASISRWLILFDRNTLGDFLMVHNEMIWISAKNFGSLISIPWVICLTVNWTYII
jgi:hypothetical protein